MRIDRDANSGVRLAAVERVTDENVLAKAAETDESHVRIAAIKRLANQAVLRRVAMSNASKDVCEAAAARMTDQAALRELVDAPDVPDAMRAVAVSRLEDVSVLRRPAADSTAGRKTRRAAMMHPALAEDVVPLELPADGNYDALAAFRTAVAQSTDVETLKKLAMSDGWGAAVVLAAERLGCLLGPREIWCRKCGTAGRAARSFESGTYADHTTVACAACGAMIASWSDRVTGYGT